MPKAERIDPNRTESLQLHLKKRGRKSPFVMIKHNPLRDREFSDSAISDRARYNGCQGEVVDFSNSHGLCYLVRVKGVCGEPDFDTGYDPSELTWLDS